MDDPDNQLRHFREMVELAEALRTLPADILSHEYAYEAFGSWFVVVRCNGVRMRLVFDSVGETASTDSSVPHRASRRTSGKRPCGIGRPAPTRACPCERSSTPWFSTVWVSERSRQTFRNLQLS